MQQAIIEEFDKEAMEDFLYGDSIAMVAERITSGRESEAEVFDRIRKEVENVRTENPLS